MEQKRSLGLSVLGYFTMAIPLPFLYLVLFPPVSFSRASIQDLRLIYLSIFVTVAAIAISLGNGIIKLSNKARKSYILLSVIGILTCIGPHFLFVFPVFLYCAVVTIYLMRPKVKEQFK